MTISRSLTRRHNEDNDFSMSPGSYEASAEGKVRDALRQQAVADANWSSPTPLQTGDFYELRDVTIET